MATFNDVKTGFDLEALIDENAIRHIIQLLADAEDTLWDGTSSLFKNFSDIERNYDLNVTTATTSDEYMRVIEISDDEDYFYLALAPLNFSKIITLPGAAALSLLDDFWIIVRIQRSFNLIDVIEGLQASDSENVFTVYGEALRIEGIQSGAGLAAVDSTTPIDTFKSSIRSFTKFIYMQLTDLYDAGTITFMPEVLDGLFELIAEELFDDEAEYEIFLLGLHNTLGISGILKDAVAEININSPFLFERIHILPFVTDNKLGIYGNLNTIDSSSRGDVDDAEDFTTDEHSGLAVNLTEVFVNDLFLSMMQFEMQKQLDDGEINQARFDEIDYSYPFAVPSEVLDSLGLDSGVSFFEVNKIEVKFDEHRFPDQDDKVDAIKIEIVLSNADEGFWEALFDAVVPNPHVELHIGFDTSGSELNLLIDVDVDIPFNLFTALITAPIFTLLSGGSFLFGLFGFTIVSNIVVDAVVDNAMDEAETDDIIPSLGFTILKKRWDPFYTTHHKMNLSIEDVLINEDPQIKLTTKFSLSKEFDPYTSLYLQEVEFSSETNLSQFQYSLSSITDVITSTLPASDRIEDMYDIDTLTREIGATYTTSIQNSLLDRSENLKIRTNIPYSPQFIRKDDSGAIELVRILSDLRKSSIESLLTNQYVDGEVQKFLDLLEAIGIVQIDELTEEQLDELTSSLEDLLIDSGSYNEYLETGLQEDFVTYLEENTDEMLTLTPLQVVLLGLTSTNVNSAIVDFGVTLEELFDFIDMPGYQGVDLGEIIYIRNIANDSEEDNLLSLPEF